ncbi:MAG: acyloxyacyl hydrolase [Pseudomonadota bacterium]
MIKTHARIYVLTLIVTLLSSVAQAGERIDEIYASWGTGPQHKRHQHNSQVALDYNFYRFNRSTRQTFSLGMGYTRLWTNAATDTSIKAFSFYPQLTLWPVRESLRGSYFFVRALGPTYISDNRLGARQQAEHFAFQAQVGVGYRKELETEKALMLQVSFKHFSNANLFSDNDGIDIPFVLTFGYSY